MMFVPLMTAYLMSGMLSKKVCSTIDLSARRNAQMGIKMIKVSDYIFQFLEGKGIKHTFMLPGGGAMHLVDSIGKSNIEYVCCQHEQAAAIAAEAYAQHTNTPGVVLVTSGPGATNAITGVVAGWIDSTPMIIISGQSKRADLVGEKKVRQIGSQEVQIIEMVKPVTKYAVQTMEPNEIRYHLERAYYEATTGRPGPVWLSIPLDVQGAVVDEEKLHGFLPEKKGNPEIGPQLKQIVKLLKESKKPLIIAGNGIKLADATDVFYKMIRQLQIPVQTTWKTIDMMEEENPLYAGHPGIMGDRGANFILQEADLLLSIGSRLDTSITAFNDLNFAKNAKKIIIDIDGYEIERMMFEKEIALVCDAKYFLEKLVEAISDEDVVMSEIEIQNRSIWLEHCKELRKQYPTVTEEHKKTGDYVSAYYFIEELCKHLNEEDVIVPESSGGAGEITYQAFKLKQGQKMKNAAGLGSMGFGLPYAIGACIANDRRRTILINGDGAFQLNIQELETLHRLQLPIKIFIWNNSGYASIRAMQKGNFAGHFVASSEDSGLTFPDILKIAEAYGFRTFSLKSNDEMIEKLPEILSGTEPILCDVSVSPDETVWPRVKATQQPDGNMISGKLENMWP